MIQVIAFSGHFHYVLANDLSVIDLFIKQVNHAGPEAIQTKA
jgi:hypothetical protein